MSKIISFAMLILATSFSSAAAQDLNVLFLGDQLSHKPAIRFEILKPVMAEKGISLTYTEDVAKLHAESLAEYDGLVLYANIAEIAPEQATALLNFVASGKGFIPIHCATFCFRNSPEVVALMGAQFRKHGKGEMTTQSAGVEHPIMDGYETFASWDETYVHHLHNETNRVVLEYRAGDVQADGNTREPWTWIRTHGKGRVFYTAWGHDERTWNQPGFHDLVERGIRWACGEGEAMMPESKPAVAMSLPKMRELSSELKPFDYIDVGPKIPNYAAGTGETLNLMQQPVSSDESMKHMITPEGLRVELFADESMLDGKMFGGKPIAMNWDAGGRLWVCETVDYPNELHTEGPGRDRIRVIEDTDADFRADKSTVFAEGLSIPTAIAFHRGGIVVQNGIETLYLKDTNGDGQADVRKVLISNWTLGDTHGGVSNFRNGLDNWIWAMQGYNNSAPVLNPTADDGGQQQPTFRMGFFRFKLSQDEDPIVKELEFVRSTTNNTWGLGISEEGLIFGSTANRQPSFFMPIANRYYERVKGWAPETLTMICPTHLFDPITDKIRQVDHHGGYTAAAGHAVYTARNYPEVYWNRTAFVCGPTGKLVGTFVIERDGAGMKSESPANLLASDDEWCAPIMAEVGPDGNVWVLDWYNYIVQHNPVPQGFEKGKGNAYETDLRDKKYGRVYRVVPDEKPITLPLGESGSRARRGLPSPAATASDPSTAREGEWSRLIADLRSPTMLVRLHAQRLLVESGAVSVVPELIDLIVDHAVDSVGLNPAAIHALHVLNGLGVLDKDGPALQAAVRALKHPSAGVRLNAVRVLPESQASVDAIAAAGLLDDEDHQVVLASLLKLSDAGQANAANALVSAAKNSVVGDDRWLGDAFASAAAMHAEHFLPELLASNIKITDGLAQSVARASEHLTRSGLTAETFADLLPAMVNSKGNVSDSIVVGISRGWPPGRQIQLAPKFDALLAKLFEKSSPRAQGELARLASALQSESLLKVIEPMLSSLLKAVRRDDASIESRLAAANSLIELVPGRRQSVDELGELIGPQSPAQLSSGLIEAINKSTAAVVGDRLVEFALGGTPSIRETALKQLLARQTLTEQLLTTMEAGELRISDLSAGQRTGLLNYPNIKIARRAERLMQNQGMAVTSDRQKLLIAKTPLTQQTGDADRGKGIFTKNCATCHVFKGEGNVVGPNLNGMSVHPKIELLTHILDPNSSVEANYRLYNVLTLDGLVISGLLSGETRTSIEMVDSQGKRHLILREDIEELRASSKSAMPEGLEQSIDDPGLVDLLEYLTQAETFIQLGLESVANVATTAGMFTNRAKAQERLRLPEYGMQTIEDVPFQLIDPKDGQTKNAVMLHGPRGPFAPQMPKMVSVRCKVAVKKLHMLAGIAGWPGGGGASMIVRLFYADGKSEDHVLEAGKHIADYIRRQDVPHSTFAIGAKDGGQVRYLAITPKRSDVIESIELVKPDHQSAPLILAMTVERHEVHGHNAHHAASDKQAVDVEHAVANLDDGDKPNILFIAIDDLNDYISPLDNHPGIKTPNFERLARRSVTFSNAHCAAPACHPSRVAVMTGVHPVKSGIYQNLFGAHGPRWRHESPVLEDAVVISQHFRNHGYRAVGGGKMFHTLQWTKGDSQNDPDAWDDYRGDPQDPISADWPRPAFVQTTDQNEGFVGKRPLSSHLFGAAPIPLNADQGDGAVVDWATEQMNAERDKPLFLAVGLFRPHIPWEVPQQWFDLYPESEVQLPAYLEDDLADAYSHGREGWHQWVTDNDQWKPLMRGYLASISYVDHQLGRLLDGLDQSPMAKRTIVVLWSDHGFHIGEKQNWEKFALWEQTTRTPLFIHAPGLSKDGAATRQPTTLTDLYPTLCELAGLPVPAQCTGASLVPQVIDPTKIDDRVSLTSYSFAKDGKLASHAVSDTRYRLIKYSNGFEELYDLENDRNEFKNLASDPAFAQVKARLLNRIPRQFAKSVGPATDSPYHRANSRKK